MRCDYIKGIIPPILTPVDDNDLINEKALRRQVDFVIEGGVNGILAFGSNGEFYEFEEEELYRGLDIILDQTAGRVPIFFGIGAINTHKCVRMAKAALKMGAKAISVLQPMFLKPNSRELLYHFGTIADSIEGQDMLLYNNPGRVGYGLTADLIIELVEKHDNIIGIKDSSGDMTLTSELIRRTLDKDFHVLGGKDTLIYGTLVHGGAGAVATTANFVPQIVCNIYKRYMEGDIKGSLEMQRKLNPIRLLIDKASFPVGSKDYANLLGRNIGNPCKPNLPSTEDVTGLMRAELERQGLL